MDNITFSNNKKKVMSKDDSKPKKKIEYTKEISDLEKILSKVEEKYPLKPSNNISGALVYIRYSIESLKKEI
jgi:lipopolysaccharide biosynthesis glycosyltransferase